MSYDSRVEEAEIEINPYATTPITTQNGNRVTDNFLESLLQTRYHTSSFDDGIYVRDRQVAKQLARDVVIAMSSDNPADFENCLRDNYDVMHTLNDDLTKMLNLVSKSCILANMQTTKRRYESFFSRHKEKPMFALSLFLLLYISIIVTTLTAKLITILP